MNRGIRACSIEGEHRVVVVVVTTVSRELHLTRPSAEFMYIYTEGPIHLIVVVASLLYISEHFSLFLADLISFHVHRVVVGYCTLHMYISPSL